RFVAVGKAGQGTSQLCRLHQGAERIARRQIARLDKDGSVAGIVAQLGERHDQRLAAVSDADDSLAAEQRHRLGFYRQKGGVCVDLAGVEGHETDPLGVISAQLPNQALGGFPDEATIGSIGEKNPRLKVRSGQETRNFMRLESGHQRLRSASIASRRDSAADFAARSAASSAAAVEASTWSVET